MNVTKTKLTAGSWHGLVTGVTDRPKLRVTHLEREVPDVVLKPAEDDSTWHLQVPIPQDAIADGIQTLLISDGVTGEMQERITFVAGEALNDDLRAEVDLLRAELDTLKRAFRRLCVQAAATHHS